MQKEKIMKNFTAKPVTLGQHTFSTIRQKMDRLMATKDGGTLAVQSMLGCCEIAVKKGHSRTRVAIIFDTWLTAMLLDWKSCGHGAHGRLLSLLEKNNVKAKPVKAKVDAQDFLRRLESLIQMRSVLEAARDRRPGKQDKAHFQYKLDGVELKLSALRAQMAQHGIAC